MCMHARADVCVCVRAHVYKKRKKKKMNAIRNFIAAPIDYTLFICFHYCRRRLFHRMRRSKYNNRSTKWNDVGEGVKIVSCVGEKRQSWHQKSVGSLWRFPLLNDDTRHQKVFEIFLLYHLQRFFFLFTRLTIIQYRVTNYEATGKYWTPNSYDAPCHGHSITYFF